MLIPTFDKSTSVLHKIYHWLNFVQQHLLPSYCALCRKTRAAQGFCTDCAALLEYVPTPCSRCGLPRITPQHCGFCLQQPPPAQRCLAPLLYQPPLSGLIHGFKYRSRLHHGKVLSAFLAAYLQQHYQEQENVLPSLLLPVPLHRQRLRQRGYNQAGELCRWLGRQLDIPYQTHWLQRIRKTASQQGLNAAQRQRNLRHAFCYAGPPLHGQTIALVDDVVTTMSTVNSLTRLLLQAGAAEIHIWALARTVKQP